MEISYTIFFFVFGLIFGSFFNVVGLRLPMNEPFTNERSYCPNCKHRLTWYELIPVISFLFLRGKCRHCGKKISILYPVIELATGLLFALSYNVFGVSIKLLIALLLVSMLMIIFISDITYMLIPNKVLLFFLPLFLLLRMIEPLEPWWSSLVGGLIGGGIVFIIILLSRGGMGAGDMKLFGVIGIILGMQHVILSFILACIIGAISGILLLSLNVVNRKQPVPFGPSIVIATVLTFFYGDQFISWYLNLL